MFGMNGKAPGSCNGRFPIKFIPIMHLNDVGDDEEEKNSDKSSCERFAMKRLFLGYNVDGTGHE